jgi:hypothetical protein
MLRTTVTIDGEQLEKAKELTGIKRTSDVINEGLSEVIRISSAKRLAALCGSDPTAYAAPRDR